MAYVLDCSVTMAGVFPEEVFDATDHPRDVLVNDRAFVPSLWPVEVGSVLHSATRRGRIGVDELPVVCASLDTLPIEIQPVSTSRLWGSTLTLARQHALSAYDATYLELALRMRLPLATPDRALAAAAGTAGVETPTIPGRTGT